MQSDEKYICISAAQALCGIALNRERERPLLQGVNANNLSVIGIYPAKKSNRNQKNNAQKESIGLCKKRIDKMEMPTKSK
ncbi:MAG: hypothetical protein SOZ55_01410, partial [Ruminococcus sp.]|nr:hypothetical protein [Ruminococcus sp.]